MKESDVQLISALRRLPVPEPRPGFAERALARATAQPVRAQAGRRNAWLSPALAAAAIAAIAILVWPNVDLREPELNEVVLTVGQPQEIQVLIGASRPLPDATIRIELAGDIDFVGFGGENSLEWQANLDDGNNLLALPVVARAPGDGRLEASVLHEGRVQRIVVELHAKPAGDTTHAT